MGLARPLVARPLVRRARFCSFDPADPVNRFAGWPPVGCRLPPACDILSPMHHIPASFEHARLRSVRAADNDDSGPDGQDGEGGGQDQLGVATKTRAKPKKPSQFKVLMLNDDYTPMEFVVMVLKRFFSMDLEQATRVMLHVHQRGVGVCGIFPYEIAETKVNQVMDFARQNQHPLQCTLEKA
jgi:ATP-dependent Clp protease adaptor protein ClpS